MNKILVVDDDKISHSFIKRALSEHFELFDVFDGEQAIQAIKKDDYSLVLLDVEMPGLNGYEVCEQIKADPETREIPIIFLSARDDMRSQMLGFEAGADDYIVKPFQKETLKAKVNVITHYAEERDSLSDKVEQAEKTAFIAIAGSSDLGQAIQFIEKSHNAYTHEQLAKTLFSVTNHMELNCTIRIKGENDELFFSSNNPVVSPLETSLMVSLAGERRFFDFGCRTHINYPNISILIKNMPLDDMERYGRIKDVLPAMLSTADIKVSQINTQQAMSAQLNDASDMFKEITGTLEEINETLQDRQKEGIKIMRNMLMELDKALPNMGLEEDQEQYILDRIDQAIGSAHETISATNQTNTYFKTVLQNLKAMLDKQQVIHDRIYHPVEGTSYDSENDEGYDMDVELF